MTNKNPLSAIIIDDEPNARENLSMMLEAYCPDIVVVGMAGGVDSGMELIREKKPDVVFLDIRMPSGAEGFDLIRKMNDQQFFVVFVTAFREYALEAFKANAVHYILKPIDIEDLKTAVDKLLEQNNQIKTKPEAFDDYKQRLKLMLTDLQQAESRLAIHHSRGIKLVKPAEIDYVQADGNCSLIKMADGSRYLDTRTLKVYDDLLSPFKFLRVHRSYIVNLSRVEELLRENGTWLLLKNNQRIPVSKKRLTQFLDSIESL